MENASKALIIAGAILLSIVLISLGLIVVNRTQNTVKNANVDQQEITSFNNQFESYVGKNKTAAQVLSLAQAVQASNVAEQSNGTQRYIQFDKGSLDGTASGTTVSEIGDATVDINTVSRLKSSIRYTITIQYDSKTGYVCAVAYTDGESGHDSYYSMSYESYSEK